MNRGPATGRAVVRAKWRRPLALVAVPVVGALAVAGCSASAAPGPNGQPALTLYSGQHEQTTNALVAAFTKATGIPVQVRHNSEDALSQQIQQEGSASPADVIYTENSPPLMQLSAKHLLSPVDSSSLAAIPPKYNGPSGDWIGVSARVSTIVYNTSQLSPSQLPTSVMQLADPKWQGKLDLAPSEADLQPVITSIEIRYGQDAALKWLAGVKRNAGTHLEPDNETVVSNVNRGLAAIGLVNNYYWYRLKAEVGASGIHSAVAFLAPHDAGYVVNVSGAGVLKSSKHQAEAQQLVAFLVSKPGQEIIAHSDSFEYPLAAGVPSNPALKPFSSLEPTPLSVAALGDGRAAVALLQDAGLL
jgi:iron(III) transport system substrate-binding protein